VSPDRYHFGVRLKCAPTVRDRFETRRIIIDRGIESQVEAIGPTPARQHMFACARGGTVIIRIKTPHLGWYALDPAIQSPKVLDTKPRVHPRAAPA
jgi:hypothetical protein